MRGPIVILVSLFVCGCSGGSATPADFKSRMEAAVCARYVRCGVAQSSSSCLDMLHDDILARSPDLVAASPNHKVTFDESAASTCLQASAMASCDLGDDLAGVDPSCLKVYVGEVPLGSGCSQGECVPAAYCDAELSNVCPGKCVQRLPAGSSATQLTQCELGLVLFEGKCTKPRAEGESCDLFASNQPTGCAHGLFCTSSSGCKSLKAIGATCTSADRCAFGHCSTAGTCVGGGDIGATCDTTDCKIELVCAGSLLLKCEARKPRGAACTNGSQCEPGLRCAYAADGGASDPTCVARLNDGEACSAPLRECANANFCDLQGNHTCKARLELGAPCTDARACKSSFCTGNVCSPASIVTCK